MMIFFFNKPFEPVSIAHRNITKWIMCIRLLKLIRVLVLQAGGDLQEGAHTALGFAVPVLGAVRCLEPLGQSVHYF